MTTVSAAPDTDAFISGGQLVLGVVFLVVVGLVGLSILRRLLGS
jgi:hypothetical protein